MGSVYIKRVKIYYEMCAEKHYHNFLIDENHSLDWALKRFCELNKPEYNDYDKIIIEFVLEEEEEEEEEEEKENGST